MAIIPGVVWPGPAKSCPAQTSCPSIRVHYKVYHILHSIHDMLTSLFNKRQRTRDKIIVIRKGKLKICWWLGRHLTLIWLLRTAFLPTLPLWTELVCKLRCPYVRPSLFFLGLSLAPNAPPPHFFVGLYAFCADIEPIIRTRRESWCLPYAGFLDTTP